MNEVNKILIIHTSTIVGGAEYSLLEFLKNLKRHPVEIHLVLPSPVKKMVIERIEYPVYFHDIKLSYFKKCKDLKTYFRLLLSLVICNYKIFKLIQKLNIETIYCNTFRTLPYCLVVKLLGKTKVVCHCRDNIHSQLIQYFIKYSSNKVIVVSEAIKSQISANTKIKVIHNGVNIDHFSDNKPTKWLHTKLNLRRSVKLVGNVGQIVNWKNQLDFILVGRELIKSKPDLHFILIGATIDVDYYQLLKQQIHAFQLESYFSLTGHVEDIKEYICELDILLHTAIDEPFGRVLIETGAASIPVVAYDSGGPAEIIRNEVTGFLVQSKDIFTMAEKALQLLNSSSLRGVMGQSAQMYVSEKFNSIDYSTQLYNALIYD